MRKTVPNSRTLGAGAAGAGNMLIACAAAFNREVWTCATTPRRPRCPSCLISGITSPGAALCTAQQNGNRTDSSRQEYHGNGLHRARTAIFDAIWAWASAQEMPCCQLSDALAPRKAIEPFDLGVFDAHFGNLGCG